MKRIFTFAMIVAILVASVLTVPVAYAEGANSAASTVISVWNGEMPTVTETNIFAALGQPNVQGSESDPIILDSAEDVAILAQFHLNGNDVWTNNKGDAKAEGGYTCFPWFRLECDIDLNGHAWPGIGAYINDNGSYKGQFKGKFDGNGHVIYNMDLTPCQDGTDAYAGFFGYVQTGNCVIKNLGIAGDEIVVEDIGGTFTKVYVGALVGCANNGVTIENCFNTAKVNYTSARSTRFVGGLIGQIAGGGKSTVKNCFNTGDVTVNKVNADQGVKAAGLIAYTAAASVSHMINCYNVGDVVVAPGRNNDTVGSLLGENNGNSTTWENCYAGGSVTTTGYNYNGTDVRRGAIGQDWGATTTVNCFYNCPMTLGNNASEVQKAGNGYSEAELSGMTYVSDEIKITSTTVISNSGYQTGYAEAAGEYKIRFVSDLAVTPYAFEAVGYEVKVSFTSNGAPKTASFDLVGKRVYTSVVAGNGTYTPSNGDFLIAQGITDIDVETATFVVTPFIETADGDRIYGSQVSFTDISLIPPVVA